MKRHLKALLALCCLLVLSFTGRGAASNNLLDKMSAADWRALNVFFSNFCEANLPHFNIAQYDEKDLIAFALSHNVINSKKQFKEDSEGYYLTKERVNSTIEKYFGIKSVTPQSAEEGFVVYKNNRYYWDDVLEGSPWFCGAQTLELYQDSSSTFLALVAVYSDNEAFQNNVGKFSIKDFYAPKKNWKKDTAKYYDVSGYRIAQIASQVYNGKKTYKLMSWRSVESAEDGRMFLAPLVDLD